jgi:hypothetical protein
MDNKRFMAIGRDVVVIAIPVVGEGKCNHNHRANGGGRPTVGNPEKTAINQHEHGGGYREIRKNQRAK